jgi:hypothetical protein
LSVKLVSGWNVDFQVRTTSAPFSAKKKKIEQLAVGKVRIFCMAAYISLQAVFVGKRKITIRPKYLV